MALVLSFATLPALAQTKVVTGKVVDGEGQPVVGAMIQIKGTNVGTITDLDGLYSIKAKGGDVLLFSSIGYNDLEKVLAEGAEVVDFQVEESATTLDDAVVVGYGTVKRRDLTGSVTSVDSKAILEKTPTNVFEALQGNAAGVQVMTNAAPGEEASIRIRGTATFGSGANPLYVVDEVPMTDISTINPNDIVSMEVLKDAASAAIYGSRSANGVIIITTRRGEEGHPRVDLKYNHGIGQISHLLPATTPQAYRYYNQQRRRWVPSGNNWRLITDSLRAFVNGDGNQAKYLLRIANKDEVNASVSAVTGKMNYFLSTGFLDERGIVVNTRFQRFTTRMNATYKATDNLTIGNNFQFTYSDQKGADEAMMVSNMYQWLPYYNLFLADGSPSPSVGGKISPYSQALLDVRQTKRFRATGQVFAELRLTDHLKFKANLSAEMNLRRQAFFRPKALLNASGINYGYDQTNLDYNWINEDYLSYENMFGDHSITVMGGVSLQYYQIQYAKLYGTNFNGNDIWTLNNATVFPAGENSSTVEEHSMASFFVRGTYNWKSRYLLALNGRYDGSSRFSKSKRWGFFPSASAGWRFSDEPFMEWSKDFLTDGKIRASIGVTGNEDIANYASWPVYSSTGVYGGVGGMTPNLVYNDLSWERTRQIDLGADISLIKGRVNVVFDWYNKDTDNLLYSVNVPKETGYSNMMMNVGSINNRGVEFSINAAIIQKRDFNWTANFNISHNVGTIIELADHASFYAGGNNIVWVQEGHRLGEFYVVKHDGIFAYDESNAFDGQWRQLTPVFNGGVFDHYELDGKTYTGTVNKKKQGSTVLMGGDVNWLDNPEDVEGLGVIDWTSDRVYGGCSQPDVYGGLGTTVSWKGFSLYVQFNYSLGGDIYNQALYGRNGFTLGKAAPTNEFIYNAWTNQGDVAKYPKLDSNRSVNKQGATDFWIEDGSFIRFQTARFTYNLPETLLQKIRMKEASVYIYGNNLLTWTNYSGFDPEFSGDILAPGVDNGRYPRKREFGLGLNVTF